MHAVGKLGLGALLAALVSGCGGGDPQLMNIQAMNKTPDEFAVLPTKPLEMPKSFAELPPPTPGAPSRTDPTPDADAIAALGGNVARGVPGDPALMRYVSRFGVTQNIRQQTAAEDLDYRRRHDGRLLERMFNVNVYYRAYRPQALDQYADLERWRQLGVRNVGAPPAPANTD